MFYDTGPVIFELLNAQLRQYFKLQGRFLLIILNMLQNLDNVPRAHTCRDYDETPEGLFSQTHSMIQRMSLEKLDPIEEEPPKGLFNKDGTTALYQPAEIQMPDFSHKATTNSHSVSLTSNSESNDESEQNLEGTYAYFEKQLSNKRDSQHACLNGNSAMNIDATEFYPTSSQP